MEESPGTAVRRGIASREQRKRNRSWGWPGGMGDDAAAAKLAKHALDAKSVAVVAKAW